MQTNPIENINQLLSSMEKILAILKTNYSDNNEHYERIKEQIDKSKKILLDKTPKTISQEDYRMLGNISHSIELEIDELMIQIPQLKTGNRDLHIPQIDAELKNMIVSLSQKNYTIEGFNFDQSGNLDSIGYGDVLSNLNNEVLAIVRDMLPVLGPR